MLSHDNGPGRDDAWLVRETAAAMRDLAGTVTQAPPLRQPSEYAAGSRRGHSARPNTQRTWIRWGAPLAAAAAVIAVAGTLVLVKGFHNGSAVPSTPAASAGTGAVPSYYVVLKQFGGNADNGLNEFDLRSDIVVGDSLTGHVIATFTPPARTVFESVTAAGDDQTFVVFAVASATGSFTGRVKAGTLTGLFYEVRLAPGTADPARLSRLPIQPFTVPATVNGYSTPGVDGFIDSFAAVVSGSGKELAVPVNTGLGLAVKVYSVATGQLLHDWTTNDLSIAEEPSLTWIDGDKELALESRSTDFPPSGKGYVTDITTVREWPVAGPVSGDLGAVSKVVWDVPGGHDQTTSAALQNCVEPLGGVDVISADGKALSCGTASGHYTTENISFLTFPIGVNPAAKGIDYRTDYLESPVTAKGNYDPEVLWSSPSGGTLIAAVIPLVGGVKAANGLQVGVLSDGRFTPVRFPPNLLPASQQLQPDQIAF